MQVIVFRLRIIINALPFLSNFFTYGANRRSRFFYVFTARVMNAINRGYELSSLNS